MKARRTRVGRGRRGRVPWYWVTVAMAIVKRADVERPKAVAEAHLCHFLVRAQSHRAALSRAGRLGRSLAGDDRRSLTLYGKPAVRLYIGTVRATELLEEPYNGCEIGWDLKRSGLDVLRRRVRKSELFTSRPGGRGWRQGGLWLA